MIDYTGLIAEGDKAAGVSVERQRSGHFNAYLRGRLVGQSDSLEGAVQRARACSKFTHYTVISRSAGGLIERQSGQRAMVRRGIKGVAGATQHAEVVSVEPERVAGWGDATAIGRVQEYMDDKPYGEPLLALLS